MTAAAASPAAPAGSCAALAPGPSRRSGRAAAASGRWGKARDRERNRARFELRRSAVAAAAAASSSPPPSPLPGAPSSSSSASSSSSSSAALPLLVTSIESNRYSTFSLSFLARNRYLLSEPVPLRHLNLRRAAEICSSRWPGTGRSRSVAEFLGWLGRDCDCDCGGDGDREGGDCAGRCGDGDSDGGGGGGPTPLEYAALLGQADVLKRLLGGAPDPTWPRTRGCPCGRRRRRQKEEEEEERRDHRPSRANDSSLSLGGSVVRRLFLDPATPRSLAAYAVAAVVEMRLSGYVAAAAAAAAADPGSDRGASSSPRPPRRRRRCPVCDVPVGEGVGEGVESSSSGGSARPPFLLRFGRPSGSGSGSDDPPPRARGGGGGSCHHAFCEACAWEYAVMRNFGRSYGGDVVRCPVCDGPFSSEEEEREDRDDDDGAVLGATSSSEPLGIGAPSQRDALRRLSLERYRSLPATVSDLKLRTPRRRPSERGKGRNVLPTSWRKALEHCLGSSGDVRGDRFLRALEVQMQADVYGGGNGNGNEVVGGGGGGGSGSLGGGGGGFAGPSATSGLAFLVRAYLEAGVDVGARNEYGQTALHLAAAWRGSGSSSESESERESEEVVRLLLRWGADPAAVAHGNVGAWSVAVANGRVAAADLIRRAASEEEQDDERGNDGGEEGEEGLRSKYAAPSLFASLKERLGLEIRDEEGDDETSKTTMVLETVLPPDLDHPGAGSYRIDNALPGRVLDGLEDVRRSIPVAASEKTARKAERGRACSQRSYLCDAEGCLTDLLSRRVRAAMARVVAARDGDGSGLRRGGGGGSVGSVAFLPHMRFLSYHERGGYLAPHVDLARTDPRTGTRSTHTFILYLSDCAGGGGGGETALLAEAAPPSEVVAKVSPKRGRLFLFPHACPHEGMEVLSPPKILLRGEAALSF